ncbi:Uncharacterised protein [Mycobacteroides abscessus subsp. abscessus]|uniref:hypothetical protein n=1 Tax=Mycobacteroides abscessus TaxID=36809 RepID=UPI000928A12C|nr:hypothetical protein [Mycobacteroides abscessus]MBE5513788.1 hypothetical protein [Mycobacteroides abscessus]MBN7327666.1 hypothetical protein [Mycobacteroides abscessus subsp. abscessus]SID61464.1 Uncharacterised protein [Mycobacteroides abscessus subsp. abscessus]SIE84213.1 Uncharacterised protein [Mycobacteroides abscessus subsp. abscessus]SIF71885.1 Uncharacterised protein [Mycobacteroides abscessus subsp. abscessus]
MAFKTPTPDQQREAAQELPHALPHLAGLYSAGLADLHTVIDRGSADPDRTLAAIATWWDKDRRAGIRRTERQIAAVLIAAGEPGGAVCRGLGISRTRLQQRLRNDASTADLVPKGQPPIRKPKPEEAPDAVA